MHQKFLNLFHDEISTGSTNPYANWNVSSSINFRIVICFAIFLFPYLAFLLILPGIREKRIVSFVTISMQFIVGALLMASIILPYWKVGEAEVISQFQAFSLHKHEAHVGINVGLQYFNITLKYVTTLDSIERPYRGLYLNEQYLLNDVAAMNEEVGRACRNGIPYPMLKVLEYLSLTHGSFAWGQQFRSAGHYANAILWSGFAFWILQCVMLALVPHHYSKTGILSGLLVLLSVIVYVGKSPADLHIPFQGVDGHNIFLRLEYGSCFYTSITAGLISVSFGIALSLLQFFRLYSISTCLSSNLDATVGPKCYWRGAQPPAIQNGKDEWSVDDSLRGVSSNASTTSGTGLSYVSDETLTNADMSHPPTASTTKCSSLLNAPMTPSSEASSSTTSLKRPLKSHTSAVEHLVSNALALTNNGSVGSTINDRSLDILRRRTHEKGPQVNSIVNKLKNLEARQKNGGLGDSSGFQSRSSISISPSASSLESIALNECCQMTDDEADEPMGKTGKSFKSNKMAF